MGRATQGVRIINLSKKNDSIASICVTESDPEEEVEAIEEGEVLPDLDETEMEAEEAEDNQAEEDADSDETDESNS